MNQRNLYFSLSGLHGKVIKRGDTMENLIFCFNATVPIFLTMIAGMCFRKFGLFSEDFVKKMNQFVFKAALPVLLFQDISNANFYEVWDTKFVLFCFGVTLISISLITVLSFFIVKDHSLRGEFIQASYRSSAAILGIAFIQNIYGNAGMAPLMIIGSVPLYNAMAVVVLSLFRKGQKGIDRVIMKKTAKGIITNPIILGILFGLFWSVLKLPQPVIMQKTIKNIAVLATPLGLMALGGEFDIRKAAANMKMASVCTIIKLVILPAIFLPLAISIGFTESKLIAILTMLGSATTVSSFVMAKNMGHDGTLSSSVVMITTAFSAFTLTAWLYLLKTLALI